MKYSKEVTLQIIINVLKFVDFLLAQLLSAHDELLCNNESEVKDV